MLEGQLLPTGRVRVRAWNNCELVLSSTPVVSYAAQARKTQAKTVVAEQLISKMAAVAASLAVRPVLQPPQTGNPVLFAFTPRPRARPLISVERLHSAQAACLPTEGGNASWGTASSRPAHSIRTCAPLTSSNLFAFPCYTDRQQEARGGEEGEEDRAEGEEC